jgi:hypothetical protein
VAFGSCTFSRNAKVKGQDPCFASRVDLIPSQIYTPGKEPPMAEINLTMRDIYSARARIAPLVRRTPLVTSPELAELTGRKVTLKLENLQETGSFKARGATRYCP